MRYEHHRRDNVKSNLLSYSQRKQQHELLKPQQLQQLYYNSLIDQPTSIREARQQNYESLVLFAPGFAALFRNHRRLRHLRSVSFFLQYTNNSYSHCNNLSSSEQTTTLMRLLKALCMMLCSIGIPSKLPILIFSSPNRYLVFSYSLTID